MFRLARGLKFEKKTRLGGDGTPRRGGWRRGWCAGAGVLLAAAALAGCTEEKVVGVKGWAGVAGFPGAQGGIKVADSEVAAQQDRWAKALEKMNSTLPGTPVEGRPLRRALPGGGYYLISRAPRDVMVHLFETLRDEEYDLLLDQVLAQRTKQAYLAAGKDPKEAVQFLVRHQADVDALLAAMPAGEQTPGVLMTPLGDNAFSMELSGSEMMDLRYRKFEVVLEKGQFRFLMMR